MDAAGGSVDPRVERSRRVICDAALDEMAEVGYGAMSIESIAKRAGVGKATVYRHWQGKLDLVETALTMIKDEMVLPTDGTVRDRVTALLGWLAGYLADSKMSACMPALVSASQYDDSVREFHHRFSRERRKVLLALLEEGVETGEIDATVDIELLAEALVGPLFYRKLMSPEPFPSDRVGEIVTLVLGPA